MWPFEIDMYEDCCEIENRIFCSERRESYEARVSIGAVRRHIRVARVRETDGAWVAVKFRLVELNDSS